MYFVFGIIRHETLVTLYKQSRVSVSSVGIATDYGLDGPGSNPSGDEIFRPSRPALWSIADSITDSVLDIFIDLTFAAAIWPCCRISL